MRFQVFAHNLLIGESDLPDLDRPMGIAYGDFVPAADYPSVQAVFRLYAEAGSSAADQDQVMLERYWRECDDLDLTIRLSDGEPMPVQWVHIEDFSPELGEMSLTVALSNGNTLARFLGAEAFS